MNIDKRKLYIAPEVDVIEMDASQVICTSGIEQGTEQYGEETWNN